MSADSISAVWKRIFKWYKTHADKSSSPEFHRRQKPVPAKELASTEKKMSLIFPDDLRATYRLFDGDQDCSIYLNYYMMPLSEIFRTWEMLAELRDESNDVHSSPKGPIKHHQWWSLKWIPFLSNGGGDHYCIDMDPPKKGVLGQVIHFDHETGPSAVIAKSPVDFLSRFADDLENGKYRFEESEMSVVPAKK